MSASRPARGALHELGHDWTNGRVQLRSTIKWNGRQIGRAHGGELSVGFHDLVAHAAGLLPHTHANRQRDSG